MNGHDIVPKIFTADAIGEPGSRAFYVQAQSETGTRSFALEKEQVGALAEKVREVLVTIDDSDTIARTDPARDPALALAQPVEAEWRVGTIGIAYDESDDVIVILMQPVEEEESAEEVGIRFLIRRDQARAFVLHALAVVSEGRPICQLCGLPMDPAGHKCPAVNGHHMEA